MRAAVFVAPFFAETTLRFVDAAASLDGMNLSAVGTAKMLLARLRRGGLNEEAEELDLALARLDPKLLELPAFEQTAPGANPTNWQSRRGRPRSQNQ